MAAPSVVLDGLSTPPETRVGPAFGDLLARASRLGGPTPPAGRRTDETAHPGDEDLVADIVIEDLVAAGEVLSAATPGMGRPLHLQDGRGFGEVLAEALTVLLPAAAETERVCGSADAFVPGRAQRNGAGLATRLVPGTLTAAAAARLACSWPRAGSVAVSDADVDMSRALRRRLARAGAISGCTFDGDALTVAENSPLLGSDRARPEELAMSRTAESAAGDDNKGADQCLISISM